MGKPEPKKRQLNFDSFEELDAELDKLLAQGYTANGNWNLAQACSHCADWMRFPVDGFPTPPIFLRPIFWIMKVTVGQRMKVNILENGFKGGMMTAPETVPQADAQSDQAAVQQFRETIARVRAHDGELHPSPIFGPMSKPTLEKVTLLHAAHHLGYLEPNA